MFVHREKTHRNERLVHQGLLSQSRDSKVHRPWSSPSELQSGITSSPSLLNLNVLNSYLDNAQTHALTVNRSRKAEKRTKRVRFDESSFQTKMVRVYFKTVYFDPQVMDLVMSHDRLLSSRNIELFRIDITQNQKARFVSHSESLYHSFYVAKLNLTSSKILNFMRIVEGGRLQKHRLHGYQTIYLCPWVPLWMIY